MKLIFPLLIISLVGACDCNVKLDDEKEVRNALINKWETDYMVIDGLKTQVTKANVKRFEFNVNGTYSSGVKDVTRSNVGGWLYDSKTNTLFLGSGNNKMPGRIVKLTGKELVLSEYMTLNGKIVDSILVSYRSM